MGCVLIQPNVVRGTEDIKVLFRKTLGYELIKMMLYSCHVMIFCHTNFYFYFYFLFITTFVCWGSSPYQALQYILSPFPLLSAPLYSSITTWALAALA